MQKKGARVVLIGFLMACIVLAISYRQILKHKVALGTLSEEVNKVQLENLHLKEQLIQVTNAPKQLSMDADNPDGNAPDLNTALLMKLAGKDPNTATMEKQQRLSSETLKIVQHALQQVQRQKNIVHADNNEIALLRQENEQLKKDLAQLRSQLGLQQTGTATLAKIQTEKSQTQAVVATIVEELRANPNPTQRLKLIQSLAELAQSQEPSLLPILEQCIDDPSDEIRHEAMELLNHYQSSEAIPLLSAALDASDTETQIAALELARHYSDPAAADLFIKGIQDTQQEVREAAMAGMEQLPDETQFAVYTIGITSAYPDIKQETLSLLELRGGHRCVDITLDGLKDSDPAFVQQVNSTLTFLVGQEFESYQQGKAWWQANQKNYDENLIKK